MELEGFDLSTAFCGRLEDDANEPDAKAGEVQASQRRKTKISWDLVQTLEGPDGNAKARDLLRSLAGPEWFEKTYRKERPAQECHIPLSQTPRVLLSGDCISEYKCPFYSVRSLALQLSVCFGFAS